MDFKDPAVKKKYNADYYAKNKESTKARKAALTSNDPTYNSKVCARYRKKHGDKRRFIVALSHSRTHARRLGHLPCAAGIEEITAAFTGQCQNPACLTPEAECTHRLCLDHDHVTGRFRGWLCGRCNTAAGLLDDSQEKIAGLAAYLKDGGQCLT